MKKQLLLSFAFLFVMMLGKGFSQDLLFEQTMEEEAAGGVTSANLGDNNFEVADNFTDINGTVNQVVFYGLYAFHDGTGWLNVDPGETLVFNVRFFDHDDTHPDWDNPAGEHLAVETTAIEHSWQWGNGFDVWMYTIDIPDTHLDNGWISIQSQGGDGWFMWHNSFDGDNYAWQENWDAKSFDFANLNAKGNSIGVVKDDGLDHDLAFEFYGTKDDNDDDPDDSYTVALNVDMTDAVAEGDVEFDPEIHHVWVTGTFADWATPGDNVDFQLHPADHVTKDAEIMYPVNWENHSDVVLYTTAQGYVVGTNEYGDIAKAQLFPNDEELEIHGAHYWIGDVDGSDGEIHFQIWDFNGEVGDVLASATMPVADLVAGDPDDFDTAMYVEFDEPVTVSSDFIVGINVEDVYDSAVGLFSSVDGDGLRHAYEQWDDGTWFLIDDAWGGLDFDIAIFPVVGTEDNGEEPEEHIYTLTFEADAGDHEYKYFLVEDEPTWGIGEWPGEPNRTLHVDGDMEVHDVFGEQPEPEEEFTVTFVVEDEDGNAIEDAVVTFDGVTYDAGHYVIEDLEEGTYDYMVEKDGYITDDGTVEVDEDKTVEVTLVADDVFAGGPDDLTLNIFPNPASDVFYIESDAQISEIRMYDVLGQVVYTGTANDTRHEISVGGMRAGVYFVQLTTEAGMVTQRVQVTR